jgi:hypothetical protein
VYCLGPDVSPGLLLEPLHCLGPDVSGLCLYPLALRGARI